MGERMNQLCAIHTLEYYSALKSKAFLISFFFFSAWLNFEDIIIQAKKDISSKTNMLHVNSEEVFEAVTPIETENRLVSVEA